MEHNLYYLLKILLPKNATLLNLNGNNNSHPYRAIDIDGDGFREIIFGYKLNNRPYIMVLKHNGYNYSKLGIIEGNGCGILNLSFKWNENLNNNEMIVTWKIHSRLGVRKSYIWNGEKFILKKESNNRLIGESLLYPASESTFNGVKVGYIDERGEFIISPKYDFGEDFQENNLAVVTVNDLSGIINIQGKYIVKPSFRYIGPYEENRAVGNKDDIFYLLDEKGKVLFKNSGYIDSMNNNRAAFSSVNEENNTLYGYIDNKGNMVIPPKYKSANAFNDGRAVVEISDNKFAIINREGREIKTFNYPYVGNISEGLLPYKEKIDGDFGYIDENGKVIIPPKFTGVESFKDGRAVISIAKNYDYKYGLIDKKGNYIFEPIYGNMMTLGENRVALGKAIDPEKPYLGYKYALGDYNGNILTDFKYNSISQFDKGYSSVSLVKETYFIDSEGVRANNLPSLKGDGTLTFIGNLIKAMIDNRSSYLDLNGKIIWEENHSIVLNNQFKIIEKKYKPKDDYIVYYPVIDGFKDKELENKVNNKLKELSLKEVEDPEFDYSYNGDFSLDFYKKYLAQLKLVGYLFPYGAAHGMPSMIYTPIDLRSGKFYKLGDLFKKDSDYLKTLSDIVLDMIKNSDMYWVDEYTGIKEDQPFYVDDSNLYIYFTPYEIAPYAAGFPTFKIPFKDIMNIIDVRGDFYKSFN